MQEKICKVFLGKARYYHYGNYEEVGNYVYTISEREMEKVALGLNLPAVSFKGINDLYVEGVEFEPADDSSEKFRMIKRSIQKDDRKTKHGVIHAGLLAAVIFKEIDCTLLKNLEAEGFVNHVLPRNPYV